MDNNNDNENNEKNSWANGCWTRYKEFMNEIKYEFDVIRRSNLRGRL